MLRDLVKWLGRRRAKRAELNRRLDALSVNCLPALVAEMNAPERAGAQA